MKDHISRLKPQPVVASCSKSDVFGVVYPVTRVQLMLITCFIFARLDYCNAMFTGLPRCDLDRLQAVQNTAVKLMSGAIKFDHVTPLLRERHSLPVKHRITFKMVVMT